MKEKILVICGPTATGKTSLAIYLAKKYNGELVSADSRQVYRKMDIGTGKDWDEISDGKNTTVIHGYDLVDPHEQFSVSKYVNFAGNVISDIHKRGKLPILVGGTGLYIKAVIDGIETVSIPRSNSLREKLCQFSVKELFEKLALLDSIKAASLNQSDRKNSRRLIRAIEIATWNINHIGSVKNRSVGNFRDVFFIGLNTDMVLLKERIEKRVEKRMETGFVFEVENLLRSGIDWSFQSMDTFGYKEMQLFLKRGLSYEEFTDLWTKNEIKYAKRQLTWFKKDKRIHWVDTESADFFGEVDKLIERWYSSN